VHYDVVYLREEAKVNIRSLVDDKLPSEYAECLTGLHLILREAWTMSQDKTSDKRAMSYFML
jgi:hypothetical protein